MAVTLSGSVTVTESASATTLSPAVPAGAAVGEYLLLAVAHSTTTAVPDQTGWTSLVKQPASDTGPAVALFHRLATGSEPASYTITGLTSGRVSAMMARISGVNTSSPFVVPLATAVNAVGTGTGTEATFDPVSTTSTNALVVNLMGINSASNTLSLLVPPATDTVPSATAGTGSTSTTATTSGTGRRMTLTTEARPTAGSLTDRTWTKTTLGTLLQFAGVRVIYQALDATTPPVLSSSHRIVGIPGATTAQVGVRVVNTVSARLKVGTNAAVSTGVIFGSSVIPDAQGAAILPVTGLTAGTRYYYRVELTDSLAATSLDAESVVGTFLTAPTGQGDFAVCVASCCNATDSDAMTAIAARGDDLFLHLGDLYYADASGSSLANMRNRMNAKLEAPKHASVFATTPTVYTPSDHDGMNNGVTMGTSPTTWTNWNTAFRELFPTPTLPSGSTGCYFTFMWHRVRFIVLDGRNFKSDPAATDNASKTALGTVQKQWLMDTLTASEAALNVLVQEAPWTGTTVGDDGWAGFTTERAELGTFFAGIERNILMLAGDMHALAAQNGVSPATAGGIAVFQASPLSNNSSIKGSPYTTGPYPASGSAVVQQYGRVVITDAGSSITAAFTGYSSDNTVRVSASEVFDVPTFGTGTGAVGAATATAVGSPTVAGTGASAVGAATGTGSGAVDNPAPGNWQDLVSILADARLVVRELERQRPVACLDCGGVLETGPRNQLFCRFDGNRY